jgi:hypothetical protein
MKVADKSFSKEMLERNDLLLAAEMDDYEKRRQRSSDEDYEKQRSGDDLCREMPPSTQPMPTESEEDDDDERADFEAIKERIRQDRREKKLARAREEERELERRRRHDSPRHSSPKRSSTRGRSRSRSPATAASGDSKRKRSPSVSPIRTTPSSKRTRHFAGTRSPTPTRDSRRGSDRCRERPSSRSRRSRSPSQGAASALERRERRRRSRSQSSEADTVVVKAKSGTPRKEEGVEEELGIFERAMRTLPQYLNKENARYIRDLRLRRRTEPAALFNKIKDLLQTQEGELPAEAYQLIGDTVKAIKEGPPEKKKDEEGKEKTEKVSVGKILEEEELESRVLLTPQRKKWDLNVHFDFARSPWVVKSDTIQLTGNKRGNVDEMELMRVVAIVRKPRDPTKGRDYCFNVCLRNVSPALYLSLISFFLSFFLVHYFIFLSFSPPRYEKCPSF